MSDDTFIRYIDIPSKELSRLAIHQEKVGDVGCVVWDAALVLAYYLQTQKARDHFVRNKNVIELGAGTGIVGLVAAACGAKLVILTDLPELLPLLQKNVVENQEVFKENDRNVNIFQLRWGNIDDMNAIVKNTFIYSKDNSIKHEFHCVLLADCVYYDEAVEPLAITINHIIKTSLNDTIVLCCFEDRDTGNKQELQERFRYILSKKFKLKIHQVPYSDMHDEFRSPDIHIFRISK
ncbi:protein N-lysine methyltransferase METTL21D-like [Styela clava]